MARPSALGGTGSRDLCSSPLAYIGDASGFALGDVGLLWNDLRWAPVGLIGFGLGLSSKIRRCPNLKFFLLRLLLLIFLLNAAGQKKFLLLFGAFGERGQPSDPTERISRTFV